MSLLREYIQERISVILSESADNHSVKLETHYFHPDMHKYTQGHSQKNILRDHKAQGKKAGVKIVPHIIKAADGKEHVTHITYSGPKKNVDAFAKEHHAIEAEHKDAVGAEGWKKLTDERKKVLKNVRN